MPFSLPMMRAPPVRMDATEFVHRLQGHQIYRVGIHDRSRRLDVLTIDGMSAEVDVPMEVRRGILEDVMAEGVPLQVIQDGGLDSGMVGLFIQLAVFGLIVRIAMGVGKPPGTAFGGRGQDGVGARMDKEGTGVTFDDIGGQESAKQELQDVVDFLKHPERYTRLGARIPRGVLLVGPPGTSKTLLARAVAQEAGVPFFSCSGSDFVELFVGQGARRVRELFDKARKVDGPSIVFMDEIDTIGKKRTDGMGPQGGGNDEREQTINALLTEMDGFAPNTTVIVMAATNRPDVLDDALLRPGRFDRHIRVDLPDRAGRKAILRIHSAGKPLTDELRTDLEEWANQTTGFSGADLANLVNEAAILAARQDAPEITLEHMEEAFDRVVLGAVHKTALVSEDQKELVAFHEAGHALVSMLIADYDMVQKVSILPRGGMGGVTTFLPDEEDGDLALSSREYLEGRIKVALGGRVAEELVYGRMHATTGASGDLQVVQQTAYEMVTRYGFSETLPPISYEGASVSAETHREIDEEVKALVEACYQEVRDLLESNAFYLYRLAETLVKKETMSRSEILSATEGIVCPLTLRSPSE